jgi:hypothetical protein
MTTKRGAWASALECLDPADVKVLDFNEKSALEVLAALQKETERARNEAVRKQWKFTRTTGEKVIVRDVLTKILKSVQTITQAGDIIVQYDPVHAALPWAGVRMILGAALNDVETFGFLLEGVDMVAHLLVRCTIFENLYLNQKYQATTELESALRRLFTMLFDFIIKARRYFEQRTVVRVLTSIIPIKRAELEKLTAAIKEELAQVESVATLISAEVSTNIDNDLRKLSIAEENREAELRNLLLNLESPLNRMVGQLSSIEDSLDHERRWNILSRISTMPHAEHHQQIAKGVLRGTGLWLLENQAYKKWRNDSTSSVLWLNGMPGFGKSKLV